MLKIWVTKSICIILLGYCQKEDVKAWRSFSSRLIQRHLLRIHCTLHIYISPQIWGSISQYIPYAYHIDPQYSDSHWYRMHYNHDTILTYAENCRNLWCWPQRRAHCWRLCFLSSFHSREVFTPLGLRGTANMKHNETISCKIIKRCILIYNVFDWPISAQAAS